MIQHCAACEPGLAFWGQIQDLHIIPLRHSNMQHSHYASSTPHHMHDLLQTCVRSWHHLLCSIIGQLSAACSPAVARCSASLMPATAEPVADIMLCAMQAGESAHEMEQLGPFFIGDLHG